MSTKRRTGRRIAVILAVSLLAGIGRAPLSAQEPSRAALVVRHGDGTVITRCVEFSEPEITGLDVLDRSGLSFEADYGSSMGATVCRIGDEGCPASDCWCQCSGTPCTYWGYHQLVNGAWVYSDLGAGAFKVRHGDVQGWSWGEADPQGGVHPPVIEFDEICVSSEAETAMPTDAPADGSQLPSSQSTVARQPGILRYAIFGAAVVGAVGLLLFLARRR